MKKNSPLKTGIKAPEFSLKSTPDQTVSLSDFKGRPIVLVFYPADFSPVCTDEVTLFNSVLSAFEKRRAQILAISVDNVWSHLAFAKERKVQFPLLSDFHPKGEVCKLYRSYREEDGEAERALYLIDKKGDIAWSYISPVGVNPGVSGVLQALEKLK